MLGKSIFRDDAHGKVTGRTLYPGDIEKEHFLHAKLLFTGQPHARMISMDTAAAEAVPGVICILKAGDVPVNEHGLVMLDQPVMVGLNSKKPFSDVSRWEGDRAAMIVAETEEAAARARDLIEIEWEQLPVVTNPVEAMRDETIIHGEEATNVYKHYRIRKGEMAAGWAAADVIVEETYQVPMQEHAYLQPEAGVSYIDEEGRVTVEVAGQWTHEDQTLIAHALDIPKEQVRVIYPAIGGAFGGREDMSVQIVLALASQRLREMGIDRPVRIQWTREESVIGHHKRHAMVIHTRWGAAKTGELTAIEVEMILDAGSYNCTSNKVLGNAHLSVAGPYRIPNAHIDSYAVYTNNCPGGAFRGFGAPQGCFVAESQMNKLALALDIDPVELRLKNVLREGEASITDTPLPAGISIKTVIEQCADQFKEPLSAVQVLPRSFQSLPADSKALRRGRGFACALKNIGFSFGFPERSEAYVEIHGRAEIDRVVVRHAGADVGQGAHTAFKQMVAEAVGVPYEKVEGVFSDTAYTGDSGSASASRLTWMTGNAIRGAVENALMLWKQEERPAIGFFRYQPPPTEMLDDKTGKSNPNITYGYVAEGVDVTVDIETGHITIDRVVCANDVGRAVNPNLIEGQIEGAVVQAFGYAVTENLQSKNGHILNPRFSTYLIPGIRDVPGKVESLIIEEPDPQGPWGIRGMAEMPFIPLAPAITAALFDATGVWFNELPLTPGNVRTKLKNTLIPDLM